ncbi:MAG: TOBE domain-containing protein, partial [Acidaminococcaceae bacterium]|nr:TOBE domain-containing protein [Acidaminococcaceae bacterium]
NGQQLVPGDRPVGQAAKWVLGFRPSDVTVSRTGEGLKGKITKATYLGSTMDYTIAIDGEHFRTAIETHEALVNNLMFKAGEDCLINFKALHWFDAEQLKEVEDL